DSPELPDDMSHEEEEMTLDEFQEEKSADIFPHDEEVFSFPFEDEDSLDHVIHEE
ncbi:hypothetical protein KI387_032865, partial [Taxus chinensis]